MLGLQRLIGNQAVSRLHAGGVLQPKLQVGPAGDRYEQEADRVANEVVRNLAASVTPGEEQSRVRRSTVGEAVGLEGGPLGAETEAGIQRTRGTGARLPDPLRRSMEDSFGAHFGGVRVHTGPAADDLNRSLQSRAFTVGGDIYFARNQYQPHAREGQALLAHELTHTIQQGAGHPTVMPARRPQRAQPLPMIVQRKPPTLKSGKDPLKDLDLVTSRGLVYGTSTTRKETSKRLNLQDNLQNMVRYRTIDAYNLATGINAVMDGDATTGIFVVREALEEPNPVATWATHFPAAIANLQNDADLVAWITELVNKKTYIGLYDLGLSGGNARTTDPVYRMQSKNRFGKNFTDSQQAANTGLTPQRMSGWLAAGRTFAQAQTDVTWQFDPGEKADLNKWIRTAFFRRTSKLGIDFTTGRGHKVHFNISGDPSWDPSQGGLPHMKKGGLKQLAKQELAFGRLITASEYRHVTKGIKGGTIPKNLVNFYDEYKN